MSCLQYPIIRMYWDKKWRVPVICDNMTRDRFFQLRTSIKIVFDNDVNEDDRKKDRLWKLRPLIERIKDGCLKQERNVHVSIDEMIVPFSGVCNMKQYCPGKPNPVGLKVFVMANPNGLVLNFKFYQGKTTFPEYSLQGFGLAASAILHLSDSLTPGHLIYFDRFFTSQNLVDELLKIVIYWYNSEK